MKPWLHAKSSARKWGGKPEDYLEIHQFMDSSKATLADVRHRALLHNAFGCFVVERVFGVVRVNSDGREYSPREIAEQHCVEDLGRIPTVQDWLEPLPVQEWMGPPRKMREFIAAETARAHTRPTPALDRGFAQASQQQAEQQLARLRERAQEARATQCAAAIEGEASKQDQDEEAP